MSFPPSAADPRSWRLFWLIVLVGGAGWLWLTRPDSASLEIAPAPRQGAPAPPFAAELPDGEMITLDQYAGQVVVLNLWATWCPPCRAEMPDLERVWQRHRADGLVVLGLNQGETAADITAFRDEFGLTFPLALDPGGRIGRTYRLEAYPTTFFIGRDGVIRDIVYGGPMPEALIESKVQALLED